MPSLIYGGNIFAYLSWCGPIQRASNGYIYMFDSSLVPLRNYGGATGSWTNVGGSEPTWSYSERFMDAFPVGDLVHVIVQSSDALPDGNWDAVYGLYDLAAEAWDTGAEAQIDSGSQVSYAGCGIAADSQGRLMAVYSGDRELDGGTYYDRPYYAYRMGTGSSWVAGLHLSQGGQEHYAYPAIAIDADDKFHITYAQGQPTVTLYHRSSPTPSGSLSGYEAMNDTAINDSYSHSMKPRVLNYGSVRRFADVWMADAGGQAMAYVDDDGTPSPEKVVSALDIEDSFVNGASMAIFEDLDLFFQIFSNNADQDIYAYVDDGEGWHELIELADAVNAGRLSANAYTRPDGKRMLGYIYRDYTSSNVYFDEYEYTDRRAWVSWAYLKAPSGGGDRYITMAAPGVTGLPQALTVDAGAAPDVLFEVDGFSAATGVATQDFTTPLLGDKVPKAVLVLASRAPRIGSPTEPHGMISIGAADADFQWVFDTETRDNLATSAANVHGVTGALIRLADPDSGGALARASFDGFITGGFRATWNTPPDQPYQISVMFIAGVDVDVDAGTYDPPDAQNDTGLIVPGFETNAMIMAGPSVFNDGESTWSIMSFGAMAYDSATGISQRSALITWPAGQTTVSVEGIISDQYIGMRGANSFQWAIEVTNVSGSSVELTTRVGNATSLYAFGYLAIGLPDSVRSRVDIFQAPTITGSQDYTTFDFEPQAIFGIGTHLTGTNNYFIDTPTAGAFSLSMFTSRREYAAGEANENGVATTNVQSLYSENALHLMADDSSDDVVADLESMLSNGFRFGYSLANSPVFFAALGIEKTTAVPHEAVRLETPGATGLPQILTVVPGPVTAGLSEIGLTGLPQLLAVVPGAVSVPLTEPGMTGLPQLLAVVPGGASIALQEVGLTGIPEALTVIPGEASVVLADVGLTGTPQGLIVVAGAATIPLNAPGLTGVPQFLAVIPGAASLALGPAGLTGVPQILTIIPGAASLALGPVGLTGLPQNLSVVPGAVSVPLTEPGMTGLPQLLAVVPGAVSVPLTEPGMTGLPQNLAVVPGAVSVPLQESGLTGVPESLTVAAGAANAALSAAGLTGIPQALSVVPGPASILLADAGFTGLAQLLSVTVGEVTVPLQEIGLTGTPEALSVLPGAVSIPLQEMGLTGVSESLTVLPGGVTIPLLDLGLTGLPQLIDVVPGQISIPLNAVGFTGSLASLTVVPGAVSIQLVGVAFTGLPQALTVVAGPIDVVLSDAGFTGAVAPLAVLPGGATLSLEEAGMTGTASGLTVVPGAASVLLEEGGVTGVPQTLNVLAGAASLFLGAPGITGSAKTITLVPGATSISLHVAGLTGIPQTIAALAGAANVALSVMGLTGVPQGFTVIPGAASVPLQEIGLTGLPQSLASIPGGVAVPLREAGVTGVPQTISVVPGPVSVDLAEAGLTGVPQSVHVQVGAIVNMTAAAFTGTALAASVLPGAVSIPVREIGLTGVPQFLTILPGGITVSLQQAGLTGLPQTLTVIPGAASLPLGVAGVTGFLPDLSVVPGPAAVPLLDAGLTGIASDLSTIPGAITVPLTEVATTGLLQPLSVLVGVAAIGLQALGFTGSPQPMAVVGGPVSVPLSEASLTGLVQSLSAVPGAISAPLQALASTGLPQSLSVVPGAASVVLGEAGLTGLAQALSIVPGAASVPMDAPGFTGSLPPTAIYSLAGVGLDALHLAGSALALSVVPGPVTVNLRHMIMTATVVGLEDVGELLVFEAVRLDAGYDITVTLISGYDTGSDLEAGYGTQSDLEAGF